MRERKAKAFTQEQHDRLLSNKFTACLTRCTISYTIEFQNLFWTRYSAGEDPKTIFQSSGYFIDDLGEGRIYNFSSNLSKKMENGELLTETRRKRSLERPVNTDYNTMPPQQSIAAMQRELNYLRQQLEFLKKISELDNKRKRNR